MDDLHPILREAITWDLEDTFMIEQLDQNYDETMVWKHLLDANEITDSAKQQAIVKMIGMAAQVPGITGHFFYATLMLGVRLARKGLV